MTTPPAPDFRALEERIVTELRAGLAVLAAEQGGEPLSVVVLWADPYKGWYELLADTQARNEAGARARNTQMAALLAEVATRPEAWKTARSTSHKLRALSFDPRYGDYTFAEDPLHTFDVSYDAFLRSDEYTALNVGGEDGWLEGHERFAISQALLRLVAEDAFDVLHKAALLRVGYAYPDSSDAVIVAHVAAGA
ncbi:MAG: hypothetical protein KC593_01800 [Myxococcales bacterium]|nr:hypothetical protein [Myxococcales bacterium]